MYQLPDHGKKKQGISTLENTSESSKTLFSNTHLKTMGLWIVNILKQTNGITRMVSSSTSICA
jgi:hypothetical protein